MRLIISPGVMLLPDAPGAWVKLKTTDKLDRVYRVNAGGVVMLCLCDGSRNREQVVEALGDWYRGDHAVELTCQATNVLAQALADGLVWSTAPAQVVPAPLDPDSLFEMLQDFDSAPVVDRLEDSASVSKTIDQALLSLSAQQAVMI